MAVSGNLQTMPPTELLQWLGGCYKSGILTLISPLVERRFFFRNGKVVASASTDPHSYLASYVVARGLAVQEVVEKAVEIQADSNMSFGQILISVGVLTEDQLNELLRLKAEEEILDVFLWLEGDFFFVEEQISVSSMVPLALDVTPLILEGARRADDHRRSVQAPPASVRPAAARERRDEVVARERRDEVVASKGKKTTKYHRTSCRWAERKHEKRIVFASREEADRAGLTACRLCIPS